MGYMPPKNPWSAAWVQTFLNWMIDKFPKGTNTLPNAAAMKLAASMRATRIRKDINTLSAAETDNLKKAYAGILAKDSNDPNSYFVQAGFHWLPPPTYCLHHVPGYSPWHRAYLMSFENALRSVPGCESVTLPFWDITQPFPELLKSPPFDKYTLPVDIGPGFGAGYTTQRYAYSDIQANLIARGVADDIQRALDRTTTSWEEFHGMFAGRANNTIIAAHDSGHVSIGSTMASQAVTAFDPVFWFFHCNWDRLFWKWQQNMNATSLAGLLTTITDTGSRNIFTIPALQALNPFTTGPLKLKTIDVVDSAGSLDVDYEHPPEALVETKTAPTRRSVSLKSGFRAGVDYVNVRVARLDSTHIPGSFIVHLLKDGQSIASTGFLQPVQSDGSEHHAMHTDLNFDFELPRDVIANGELSVRVEPVDKSFVGPDFPPKMMGNPTVEINLLLRQE